MVHKRPEPNGAAQARVVYGHMVYYGLSLHFDWSLLFLVNIHVHGDFHCKHGMWLEKHFIRTVNRVANKKYHFTTSTSVSNRPELSLVRQTLGFKYKTLHCVSFDFVLMQHTWKCTEPNVWHTYIHSPLHPCFCDNRWVVFSVLTGSCRFCFIYYNPSVWAHDWSYWAQCQ